MLRSSRLPYRRLAGAQLGPQALGADWWFDYLNPDLVSLRASTNFVESVEDRISGYTLAQAAPAAQPLLTTIDGRSALEYDGVNCFMSAVDAGLLAIGNTGLWEAWIGIRFKTISNGDTALGFGDTTTTKRNRGFVAATSWAAQHTTGGTSSNATDGAPAANTNMWARVLFDGDSYRAAQIQGSAAASSVVTKAVNTTLDNYSEGALVINTTSGFLSAYTFFNVGFGRRLSTSEAGCMNMWSRGQV